MLYMQMNISNAETIQERKVFQIDSKDRLSYILSQPIKKSQEADTPGHNATNYLLFTVVFTLIVYADSSHSIP